MAKKIVRFEDVRKNEKVLSLIYAANKYLEVKGYNEHGLRHVGYTSKTTSNILKELGYDERTCELGAIAGFMHDIGNGVNRIYHGISGATLTHGILDKMGMPANEINLITMAIGNHEEDYGIPVNPVSAALIIADKSDAHRTRVRPNDRNESAADNIHARVNLAIKKNFVVIDKVKRVVRLVIFMDDTSSIMDFLQIYLSRMVLSEKAAKFLDCAFELVINDLVINNRKTQKAPTTLKLSTTETNVSEE